MSFYPQPRPSTLGLIPSGPAGIRITLRKMVDLTRQYRKDPGIRQLASQLVRDLPQYDTLGEIKALHAFVRDSIRYTNDIRNVELLQTPQATLEMGVGDCDDKSTLLGSLLESIGRPARYVAIALKPSTDYSHVLVETRFGNKGKWLPLETIRPVEVGWWPPGVSKQMIAHV
jgi:transglutaminase-like putative cysteine protease